MDSEQLVAELRRVLEQRMSLARETRALLADRESDALRIEQALAALLGQKLPRSKGVRGKGSSRGRGITVADVVAEIRAVATSIAQPLEAVRAAVETRLKGQGRAMQGFALRWSQGQRHPEFEVIADTIRTSTAGGERATESEP